MGMSVRRDSRDRFRRPVITGSSLSCGPWMSLPLLLSRMMVGEEQAGKSSRDAVAGDSNEPEEVEAREEDEGDDELALSEKEEPQLAGAAESTETRERDDMALGATTHSSSTSTIGSR